MSLKQIANRNNAKIERVHIFAQTGTKANRNKRLCTKRKETTTKTNNYTNYKRDKEINETRLTKWRINFIYHAREII